MRKARAKQQRSAARAATGVESSPAGGPSPPPREIFRATGRPYSWPQVLAGAYFRGDAAILHAEVADAIAAMSYAEEEGFAVPEDCGAPAGEAFRLEHNLITGEEMERWLDHCGIELDQFDAYFASRALATRFAAQLAEIRRDYAPAAAAVVDTMWTATILSGSLDAFTLPLVRRVAARADANATADASAVALTLHEGEPRVPETLCTPGLLEELAVLEALSAIAEDHVASAEHCAAELRERAYQLARIVVAEAVFASLDLANEAYQGVVADGLAFDEVARRAGVELAERTFFADEAPEGAMPLLSALPGRVLEPEAGECGYLVRGLRRRIEPDLSDPDVAARVRERLLVAHFDALVGHYVTWSFDPWTVP